MRAATSHSSHQSKSPWADRLDVFSLEKNGKVLLRNKKYSQAESLFSKLVDCGDIYWIYLGESLLGQKKYKSAKECFEHVLPRASINEEWAFDVFKNLGLCHCYLGDDEAAFENFNKAIGLKKETFNLDIACGLGVLLKNQKKYSKSQAQLQQVLEKDPYHDEAWAHLSEVRAFMGDIEMAYANLQKCLDLNPGNKQALKIKVRWSSEFSSFRGFQYLFSFQP